MPKEPTLIIPTGDSLPRIEMGLMSMITPDDVDNAMRKAHPDLKPYLEAKSA